MAFSFRVGTNWCHDFPKLARESGFHFNMHRRRVRVDWNRISSIDVDRVIGERDFSTIDENVNNVVDYCLEGEYDVKILDPNFVKLFRLAQLAVEYLLYCKQYLDHSVVILKDELRSKLEENSTLKKDICSNEKIIKELKDKLKDRNRIVETKLSDSHGEIHKCPQCPKTFISALFMNAHVNRRHPNLSRTNSNSPIHEHYRAETEKLNSEIKSLKERLNLTERVIRNESEKFMTSEMLSNDNRDQMRADRTMDRTAEMKNQRDRDELIEEQHRRYQEEIGNLKATLFNEIRNLKLADRHNNEKSENEDCSNGNIKELLSEQEKEIKILRQQLSAKTSEVEDVVTKRNNQEDIWRSKIDDLESRYRSDIEKLYAQIRETQQSADRMRLDYTMRINDLEIREASVESTLIKASKAHQRSLSSEINAKSQIPKSRSNPSFTNESQNRYFSTEREHQVENHSNEEAISDSPSNESNSDRLKIVREIVREPTTNRAMKQRPSKNERIDSSKNNEEGKRKRWKIDEIDFSLRNEFHERMINGNINNSHVNFHKPKRKSTSKDFRERPQRVQVKSSELNGRKVRESTQRQRPEIIDKKSQLSEIEESRGKLYPVEKFEETGVEKSAKNRKNSESEDSEESSDLESEILDESVSQIEEEEEKPKKNRSKIVNKQQTPFNEEKTWNNPRQSEDKLELFHSKLRDLGIDPEWRGIPSATFSQVMEIVRHHRNINSKKYRKFEELRRKIIHQLSRRLAIEEKERKIEDFHEKTQIEKLVTNVKSKVSKALNILEKNDGVHSNRRISGVSNSIRRVKEEPQKSERSPSKSTMEKGMRSVKSKYPRNQASSEESEENRLSGSTEQTIYEPYGNPDRREEREINDKKQLSHSYESIKDFIKDTGNRNQQRSIFSVTGNIVSSTPQKSEEIQSFESAENEPFRITKKFESVLESPKNSKSVLKSTAGGSVTSLVKKKVFFDLESPGKIDDGEALRSMYPTNERDDLGEEKESENDSEISSIYDERDLSDRQKDDSPQSSKIILKTSQSEKIAEISKQIEKQLSVARKKPAGAVEAMFIEKFSLRSEKKESPINVYPTTAKSNHENETKVSQFTNPSWQNRKSAITDNREVASKDSNLDMEIEELLQME